MSRVPWLGAKSGEHPRHREPAIARDYLERPPVEVGEEGEEMPGEVHLKHDPEGGTGPGRGQRTAVRASPAVAVFLEVVPQRLSIRHLLVAVHGLRRATRNAGRARPGLGSAHGHGQRKLPFGADCSALRAGRRLITADQFLEGVTALGAVEVEDGHALILVSGLQSCNSPGVTRTGRPSRRNGREVRHRAARHERALGGLG